MGTTTLKVRHICWTDSGGAGIAAYRQHRGLCELGVDSQLLVLYKKNSDVSVKVLPTEYQGVTPAGDKNSQASADVVNRSLHRWQAIRIRYAQAPPEAGLFSDTTSDVQLYCVQEVQEADVINLHWTGGVVHVPDLARALAGKPTVWTLHDENPFTGGCHYAGDCTRYMQACGCCPQLGSLDLRDFSWHLHRQKKEACQHLPITVVTPSAWLGQQSAQSSILGHCPHHVIPNGLSCDTYRPYDQAAARSRWGIPADALVLLFGATSVQTHRKGLVYLQKALEELARDRQVNPIALAIYGENTDALSLPATMQVYPLGRIDDEQQLAQAYSAANAFVLPTLADNLPNTVMEALACGCPVVGFQTGGVPEMIEHECTGFLAEPCNVAGLRRGIEWIENLGAQAALVRQRCRDDAVTRYDQAIQAQAYYDLYQTLWQASL